MSMHSMCAGIQSVSRSFVVSALLPLWLLPSAIGITTIKVKDAFDVELVGKSFGAHMPYSMTKGDFNGDGRQDLVLGSFFEHDINEEVFGIGLVSVFFGGSQFDALPGPGEQVQVGQFAGTPPKPVHENVIIYGSFLDHSIGTLLAAGDLNADGFDDLVVVAQDENPANAKPDKAEIGIFFGGPSFTGLLDFDTDVDITLSRDVAHYSALAVGDIDADGTDDLIIADDLSNNLTDPPMNVARDSDGAVYIVYGRTSVIWPAHFDLKTGAGATIVRNSGNSPFQVKSLAIGDLNKDGKADLAMGAPWEDSGAKSETGKVYLLFGAARRTGTLSIDTVAGCVISGAEADDRTGGELVTNINGHPLAIGDVNGDGIGDLVIGSPLSMLGVPGSTGVGKAEVVFGRKPFPATLDLATAADVTMILGGNPRLFYTGKAVSAEDVNGDGIGDISVSSHAWQASASNPRADGIVHTIYGKANLATNYALLTEADLGMEAPPPTHRMSGSKMGSCFVIGNFTGNRFPDIALAGSYGGLNTRGWVAVLRDADAPLMVQITAIRKAPAGKVIEWNGMTGWLFTVQYRASINSGPAWANLTGAVNLPGVAGTMQATDPAATAGSRFYRVVGTKP